MQRRNSNKISLKKNAEIANSMLEVSICKFRNARERYIILTFCISKSIW